MDVEIRRLGPGDELLLSRLEDAYERTIPPGPKPLLYDEATYLFAALIGADAAGHALAYLLPRLDGRDMLYLYEIAVAPAFRRQGIGRRLLEQAKELAVERQAVRLFLHTERDNEAAMRLYRAAGGHEVGDRVVWRWPGPATG